MKWKFLAVLICFVLVRMAWATDSLYQNNANLYYTIPGNPPPIIDATNFDNESIFSVTYNNYSPTPQFYETWNTSSFTNGGTMIVNSPISTSGLIPGFGCGYRFDTQTTNVIPRVMADTFYNPGTIRCDSIIDGNNIFSFSGFQFFILTGIGECFVSATNIVNPGSVTVGYDGLMQFAGQSVDLSRSVLTVEGIGENPFLGNLGLVATGGNGVDTNGDWAPIYDLTPNQAISSLPFILYLTNSTPYYQIQTVGTNAAIIRAVFIVNQSPNVSYNVYIGTVPDTLYPGMGSGEATIEWVGGYVNPATGANATNYLYLNDNYSLGASTNALLINGYPDNFTFTQSSAPRFLGPPVPSGFPNYFTAGYMTNWYAYVNAQLLAGTVSTNVSETNPNGSATNLPGRIQITAGHNLDMNLARITGINYLGLSATNQFDGSAGALIASPFADINLGVTNGYLTVTNLLEASIPNWNGTVQAWSTRWLETSTNLGYTFTNDFRVMIVYSQLAPLSQPQVQNLRLHATNSLVISDQLNVYGSLFIDAQSLTLATNLLGNGATSPDGELNIENNNILWPNSLPNLLWLTNNGAIRIGNLAQFGSGVPTYTTNIVPSVASVAATGILSELAGANVTANTKVTIGTNVYNFTTKLTNTTPNQIKIAVNFDSTLTNLIAAINHTAGSGSVYSSSTTANPLVLAGALSSHAFVVTAKTAGAAGNSIITTTTSANLTWNGNSTLTGGVDAVTGSTNVVMVASGYYGAFINNSLLVDQGSAIYANNFLNSSTISNGVGSFVLNSLTATLTNGAVLAGGNIAITADSLEAGSVAFLAGRGLTLQITNLLTDGGVTNGNIWLVGSTNGTGGNGLALPIKPLMGDLLGTTITNYAPAPNKLVLGTWAATNYGVSTSGYTNNVAIGRLILDAVGANSTFSFTGTGTNNALYVDYLEFRDQATNGVYSNYDFSPWLSINTNLTIYFAQAVVGGVSVAENIDIASKDFGRNNGGRLRWVPQYAGYFSSTNLVYPGGVTNTINAALAQSRSLDSDGDGIPNYLDSTPVFTSGQVNFKLTVTNLPPLTALIQWSSIPGATNTVYYRTNFLSANWLTLTNFVSPSAVPPAGGWPITNVVADPVNPLQPRFYRVRLDPNQATLY